MKKSSQILIAISALLMIIAYFYPIWIILLEAPQYPEGLHMNIWINKLSGDIESVNNLNHYIGMAYIKEEQFPELKVMPYALGIIIALGLLTAFTKNKKLLITYAVVLFLAGMIGAADFNYWEYQYGHNLDPKAAIKIEGMTYKPPFLGWKQIANFLAGSFPDIGGVALIVAGILVGIVLLSEFWFKRKKISKA